MQPTLAPQTLSTSDGANLAVYHWPADGAAHAQMVICHGMAEHGARYAALANPVHHQCLAMATIEHMACILNWQ